MTTDESSGEPRAFDPMAPAEGPKQAFAGMRAGDMAAAHMTDVAPGHGFGFSGAADNIGDAGERRAPVPDDVFGKDNYDHMKDLLKERVSPKRYKHSKGVAKAAKQLAVVYGYDPKVARMAGILHDWDKGLHVDEIRTRAAELEVDVPAEVVDNMPWLLHGPTAAAALKLEYPELGDDVFQAIARHTSGAADMAPLDCIVYVADIIEPSRTYGNMSGIQMLRDEVGTVPLERLYFDAFKYTLSFLVAHDRQLYPRTIDIWNSLMWRFGFARSANF